MCRTGAAASSIKLEGPHRDQAGVAHHQVRQLPPTAALARAGRPLGAPLQPGGRERLHPRPEDDQQRGQHDQGDGPGGQRRQGPGDPHRGEEADREEQQGGQRDRDGQRAEQDGAAGGLQGPGDRPPGIGAAGQLLAVAGEDEEAVVDPHPDADAGDEVEREHRDRRERVGTPQQQQGHQDREAADDRRQHRRDEAAEEPEREQQEEREGEQLGPLRGRRWCVRSVPRRRCRGRRR